MSNIHSLITPQNSALVLIDHQPQMLFGVHKVFNVPTILTTVAAHSFSGNLIPQIQEVFPDIEPIDRTSMNAWDDENFRKAVKAVGDKKIVIAALWMEVCLVMPVIEMLEAGYEIYIVTDASGGTSIEAHERSVQRLVQAGAIPMTWLQVLLEWQRDWARTETYGAVIEVVKNHAGAYGAGAFYASTMLGAHATDG
jgi:nicotinamidase-related amidase